MSENLKRKLTSRKFWAAVVSFVTMLIMAFGVADETATQVGSIIMAGATVIAYIIGEGMTDAAAVAGAGGTASDVLGAASSLRPQPASPKAPSAAVAAAS